MRRLLIALVFGTLPLLAGIARADAYLALEGSALSIDDGVHEELNPVGGRLRVGMRLGELFDLEAHFGRSREDEDGRFDDFVARTTGAFLKAYVPVGYRSALFALAGYSRVEFEQTLGGLSFTDTRRGAAWGFGLETRLSQRIDLTADYIRYADDDGLFQNVSSVNAGLKFYF